MIGVRMIMSATQINAILKWRHVKLKPIWGQLVPETLIVLLEDIVTHSQVCAKLFLLRDLLAHPLQSELVDMKEFALIVPALGSILCLLARMSQTQETTTWALYVQLDMLTQEPMVSTLFIASPDRKTLKTWWEDTQLQSHVLSSSFSDHPIQAGLSMSLIFLHNVGTIRIPIFIVPCS